MLMGLVTNSVMKYGVLTPAALTDVVLEMCRHVQGGSNMTGTDFFFVTIIAHHSSNFQTGLNRF